MKIKYKLKPGHICRYDTTVYSLREAEEGSYYEKNESTMEMSMTQEVVKAYSNGDMDLRVSIDKSTLWKNGEEVPVKRKEKVFFMKMSESGEVLESSGTGPQSPPLFPDRDINPGDVWKSEKSISVPSRPDGLLLKTLYKLEGSEKFNGFDCVKIVIDTEEVSLEFEEGVLQVIGGNGVTYFAPGEGKLVNSEVNTYTRTTLSDAQIRVVTKVKVNYVVDGKENKPAGDFFLSL